MKIIKRKCPLFNKGLDDRLEVKLPSGKMSPQDILTLRGLYDSTHNEPLVPDGIDVKTLTDEDIAKYSKTLSAFKKQVSISDIQQQKLHRIHMSSDNVAAAMITLNNTYRGMTKIKRIAMMAKMFHQSIEKFKKDKGITGMSNSEVIRTYFGTPENFFRGGADLGANKGYTVVARLFAKMQTLKKAYDSMPDKTTSEAVKLNTAIEEYKKIIVDKNIFQSLCIMASPQIKENDDVKYSLDFSYTLDNDESEDIYSEIEYYVAEESKKDGWMEHTDEVSSYKQMQKKVKAALKFLPKFKYDINGNPIKDEGGVAVIVTDEMGMTEDENVLTLHKALLEISYVSETEEGFLNNIESYGTINPAFLVLHSRLKNDKSLLSAFKQEYSKTHIRYRFLNKKKGYGIPGLLSGNMFSKDNLLSNWLHNIKKVKGISTNSIFKIKADNVNYEERTQGTEKVYLDETRTNEFLSFIKEQFAPIGTGAFASTNFRKLGIKDKKKVILKAMEYLNISISPETLNFIFASNDCVRKITKELYKLYDGRNLVGKEPFTSTAEGFLTAPVGDDGSTPVLDTISNIVYLVELRKPRQLEHRVNWLGKTLFNDILPSMLSNIIDSIRRRFNVSPEALRGFLSENYFISSQFRGTVMGEQVIFNRLLSDLYQDDSMLDCIDSIIKQLEISRGLGTLEKDFTEFSKAEHLENLMAEFFGSYRTSRIQYVSLQKYNELKEAKKLSSQTHYYIEGTPYYFIGSNDKKKHPRTTFGNFSTFIQGDANQLKMIKSPIYSYDECIEGLYNIALSEINYHKQKIAANKQLKSEGITDLIPTDRVFGYLHFLNNVPELSNVENIEITTDVKKVIVKAITDWMAVECAELKNTIESNDLTTGLVNGVLGRSYITTAKDKILDRAIQDFFANYALNLACVQQLSTISTSLFEGAKDFAKRNKGTHSNGKQLNTQAYNPYTKQNFTTSTKTKTGDDIQKVVILKEVALDINKIDPDFADYVKRVLGESEAKNYFKKIKSTDGQGYRLIDSYYKIKVMAGEDQGTNLTEWYTKYKELQRRAKNDNRDYFTQEEIEELEAIDYTPQPIKPITQAINHFTLNNEDTMLIAQQHKYAEIILIPEMLPKNSRLKAIGKAMQATSDNELFAGETSVDLCIFNTGVKVGSYGAVEVYDDGNGGQMSASAVEEAIKSSASNRLHRVHLKYTKIQTNTPEHIHDSRGFGTQLRKIILQGVQRSKLYNKYVKTLADKGYKHIKLSKNKSASLKNFNGNNLIMLYNALMSANYLDDYKKVKALLKDKKGLSRSLIQQTVLGAKGNLNDIIAYCLNPDGTFFAPLFDAIREHDSSANFLSLYKKIVNKQRFLGGSAVQAASFGITDKQEDESLKYIYETYTDEKGDERKRVIGAECEMTWDIRVRDAQGNEIELKFEDWCNEDGTLKTDSKGNVLLDKYYPNARKLIAYRIPTEDFYSVMNLTVVRFTRKTATGGTIKVPPQGVVQAGFDFKQYWSH